MANEEKKLTFEPTFEEGFGVMMRMEATLVRVDPDPRQKNQDVHYSMLKPNGKKPDLEVRASSVWVKEELVKLLEKRKQVKVVVVGYESIQANGEPALGKRMEFGKPNYLITSVGWSARNVFCLRAIEKEMKPDPK